MSALSTEILARLLLIRFGSLMHFGVFAVGTRLPPAVSGFAMNGTHVSAYDAIWESPVAR